MRAEGKKSLVKKLYYKCRKTFKLATAMNWRKVLVTVFSLEETVTIPIIHPVLSMNNLNGH